LKIGVNFLCCNFDVVLYVETFCIIASQSLSSVETANREVYLQCIVSTDITR